MAIERTTSIAKIEVISRGGHLACKVLRVGPRKRTQQVPRSRTRLPALPTTRTQAMEPQSITVNAQAT